jgi:hypothetical protein
MECGESVQLSRLVQLPDELKLGIINQVSLVGYIKDAHFCSHIISSLAVTIYSTFA